MDIPAFLNSLQEQKLYRNRRAFASPQGPVLKKDQGQLLNFCSNDYLGLANDKRIIDAYKKGLDQCGVGSGASQLICGYSHAHQTLEERLADFIGTERALVFGNGYMANLGVQQALLDKKGTVFLDRLVHASIIDAARLSGAKIKRYQHNDVSSLEQLLKSHASKDDLIATDSVFSMDGDIAHLKELGHLANKYHCRWLVDDAHGFAVLGQKGRGAFESLQSEPLRPDVYLATFGKALGTYGAVVAASNEIIETFIQKSRTAIYTTALPPALAVATIKALEIVEQETFRREKLNSLIAYFQTKSKLAELPLSSSQTAIQPLLVGDAERALKLSAYLEGRGILVSAIRPPTVPKGSSRLRITLSANHTEKQIDVLVQALSDYFQ